MWIKVLVHWLQQESAEDVQWKLELCDLSLVMKRLLKYGVGLMLLLALDFGSILSDTRQFRSMLSDIVNSEVFCRFSKEIEWEVIVVLFGRNSTAASIGKSTSSFTESSYTVVH